MNQLAPNWLDLLSPSPLVPMGRARKVCFDDDDKKKELRRQQIAAAHKAWYARNAVRERAKRKARYLASKRKELQQNRAWRKNNPERKRLISKLWARKRRAKLKAMGLTSRGRSIGAVNPSHFKKGWRDAART